MEDRRLEAGRRVRERGVHQDPRVEPSVRRSSRTTARDPAPRPAHHSRGRRGRPARTAKLTRRDGPGRARRGRSKARATPTCPQARQPTAAVVNPKSTRRYGSEQGGGIASSGVRTDGPDGPCQHSPPAPGPVRRNTAWKRRADPLDRTSAPARSGAPRISTDARQGHAHVAAALGPEAIGARGGRPASSTRTSTWYAGGRLRSRGRGSRWARRASQHSRERKPVRA